MKRTTIMIPDDLKVRAERRARRTGTSLGALVRSSLEAALRATPKSGGDDPLLADDEVYAGSSPPALSSRHDDYLYGDES